MAGADANPGIKSFLAKLRALQEEEAVAQRELIRHEAQRYEMCNGKDGTAVPCCELSKDKLVCAFNRAGGEAKTAELIEKIDGLLRERTQMFDALAALYNAKRSELEVREEAVVDQYIAMELLEEDLKKARASLEKNLAARDNAVREAQIGSYYSSAYGAYAGIARSLAVVAAVALVFAVIGRFVPPFMDTPMWYLRLVVCGVLLGPVAGRVWDLVWRDNMNFNQYDFGAPSSGNEPSVFQHDAQALGLGDGSGIAALVDETLGTCVGAACCSSGLRYDSKRHLCLPDRDQQARADRAEHVDGYDTLGPRAAAK